METNLSKCPKSFSGDAIIATFYQTCSINGITYFISTWLEQKQGTVLSRNFREVSIFANVVCGLDNAAINAKLNSNIFSKVIVKNLPEKILYF